MQLDMLEAVQTSTAQPASRERSRERSFVDQGPAGSVDQHLSQPCGGCILSLMMQLFKESTILAAETKKLVDGAQMGAFRAWPHRAWFHRGESGCIDQMGRGSREWEVQRDEILGARATAAVSTCWSHTMDATIALFWAPGLIPSVGADRPAGLAGRQPPSPLHLCRPCPVWSR